jgi:hypothetical protein
MTQLGPGDLQKDPTKDIRNRPLPDVKPVDQTPLEPRLIPDDVIKKGEEKEIEELSRLRTISELLKGHVAINTPGDAIKYGIGMSLGAIATKLIGC